MPSPIAHLGAGYALYRYYKHKLPQDQRYFYKFSLPMIMVTGLSLLPDLDVIPAIIFRDMRVYHNNISHSLLFAVPISFFVGGILNRMYRSSYWQWVLICLISYDLHIIMDSLTAERGVMMFWPLSQNRFVSPIRIFYGLQWGLGWFSVWHLWTIFTESVFVLVLMLIVNHFDRRQNKPNTVSSQESY